MIEAPDVLESTQKERITDEETSRQSDSSLSSSED